MDFLCEEGTTLTHQPKYSASYAHFSFWRSTRNCSISSSHNQPIRCGAFVAIGVAQGPSLACFDDVFIWRHGLANASWFHLSL